MIKTNLGQITYIRTGKLDANAQIIDGKYPFFTCGEENLAINEAAFDTEAILLAGNGNFSVKYYKGKFNAYQRTYVIEPNHVNGKWLYYLVANHIAKITTGARGSTIKYLRIGDIIDCSVNLLSIKHQERIVAKIEELFSELDKGIESLKTARAQLKVYRQALLKHAFEGKLTAEWREQNKDKLETALALQQRIQTERAAHYQQQVTDWQAAGQKGSNPKAPKPLPLLTNEDVTDLPELPEGWIYVRAEEITDFITKGTTPSKDLLFEGNGDIPFIKVYNLTKTGFLDFSINPTYVSKETHSKFLTRSKVYPDDVLMNIVGPPLGKVSIVPNTYSEWNINQAIAIFRSKLILSKLLAKYLAFEPTVELMMSKAKATAGQFNLTLEICRNTVIPFCGLNEQREIEALIDLKLSEVDQLEQTITIALQQSDALRQSILKKAFSGALVAQEANDEPASVLLARIKAEKTTKSINKRLAKDSI